jgi:hypothetical protein
MDAEEARQITIEANVELISEDQTRLEHLEQFITEQVAVNRSEIDETIEQAALQSNSFAYYEYEERISSDRRSREEVSFIETIANIVSGRLTEVLKSDGFKVKTSSTEIVDYRDEPTHPPEYFLTRFTINW